MKVSLVMFKANGDRRDFRVRGRAVIGRKNSCDLRIPLRSVSRQHCEIIIENDTVKVRDMGSSNGTYHNSRRVSEAVLSPGDEVVVGPVIFIVVINGVPEHILPMRTVIAEENADKDDPLDVQFDSEEEEFSQDYGLGLDGEAGPDDPNQKTSHEDSLETISGESIINEQPQESNNE